jgi:hypothetical protein
MRCDLCDRQADRGKTAPACTQKIVRAIYPRKDVSVARVALPEYENGYRLWALQSATTPQRIYRHAERYKRVVTALLPPEPDRSAHRLVFGGVIDPLISIVDCHTKAPRRLVTSERRDAKRRPKPSLATPDACLPLLCMPLLSLGPERAGAAFSAVTLPARAVGLRRSAPARACQALVSTASTSSPP